MQTTKRRFPGWTRRLVSALVALLLLGVAGEILLRLYPGAAEAARGPGNSAIMQEIRARMGESKMAAVPDPELGALLAPWLHETVATPDFTYMIETDHAGFSNPEPWPEHADVVVLGNSLLVGTGVGRDRQFTTLLETRLAGPTVLNLGLPGGGIEHEYRVYRRYAAPLRPELVIAVVWVVWDIDNSLQFEHWRSEKSTTDYTRYRTSYGDTHGEGAQAERAGLSALWYNLKRQITKSLLVRTGYMGVKSLLDPNEIVEQVTFPNEDAIYLSAREELRLAQGLDRPDTPDLREVFFRPLEKLRTEVEAGGGRFVVLLVPSKEEIYAAEAFPAVLRCVQEVKSELASRRLPVLDLYPVFRERGQERPPFYRIDMHLNELGNQIVADEIERWIAHEKVFAQPSTAANGVANGAD